jgi:hypothetical protein
LKFLGGVWITISVLGAAGIILATIEEKEQTDPFVNYRRLLNGGRAVEPTWLTEFGTPVAIALLIQGLTIGTLLVNYAGRETRSGRA